MKLEVEQLKEKLSFERGVIHKLQHENMKLNKQVDSLYGSVQVWRNKYRANKSVKRDEKDININIVCNVPFKAKYV